MFSRLKIGKKVAVLRFDVRRNRDSFAVGKIVAKKEYYCDDYGNETQYAVMFNDGGVEVYKKENLYYKWDKELEK